MTGPAIMTGAPPPAAPPQVIGVGGAAPIPAVHPTVPFGTPGYVPPAPAPPAAPLATPLGNYGAGYDVSQIPAPAVPVPTVGAPPAPAAVPAAAPAAAQPPQQLPIDLNARIPNVPGVPPELVGRTWGQAFQVYSALAQDWLQRSRGAQPGTTGAAPAAQPAVAGQPVAGQPAPGATPGPEWDWRQPDKFIEAAVERAVAKATRPIAEASLEDSIVRTRDAALQQVPDMRQLWPDIIQTLQGTDPKFLTDINVWVGAADLVRGRRARAAAPVQPAAPGSPNGPYAAAGGLPSVPAGGATLPQFAFFAEGPTPSTLPGVGVTALTPEQSDAARRFGMTEPEYIAWKGGVAGGRR